MKMRVTTAGEAMSGMPGSKAGDDPFPNSAKEAAAESYPPFEASWVAAVKSAADRLEGELQRTSCETSAADYRIAERAICEARRQAARPALTVSDGKFRWFRRQWRRAVAWWTGDDVYQATAALHTAGQALLAIEPADVVKSQLGDMAAEVANALGPGGDMRVKDYLKTLALMAPADVLIQSADRAQLRAIREACDSAADAAKSDARVYRNTLMLLGSLLTAVLAVVAIIAWGDEDFRSVFSAPKTTPGPWYVLELELVASLAGLTSAALTLRNYLGFQFTYGLPFVQGLLKGGTGAATGLFGVLLVQSGIFSSVKSQSGVGVFATAVVFGYAQYLFTRLVDKQAKGILDAAGSRHDPATHPHVPPGVATPDMLTTRNAGTGNNKNP